MAKNLENCKQYQSKELNPLACVAYEELDNYRKGRFYSGVQHIQENTD